MANYHRHQKGGAHCDRPTGIDQTVWCHAAWPYASDCGRLRSMLQFIANQRCPKCDADCLPWRDNSWARRRAVSQIWIAWANIASRTRRCRYPIRPYWACA